MTGCLPKEVIGRQGKLVEWQDKFRGHMAVEAMETAVA